MSFKIESITPSNTTDSTTRLKTTSIQLVPAPAGKGSSNMTNLSFKCMFEGDDTWVTMSGLNSYTMYPFQIKYISATGTSSPSVIVHKAGRRGT